MVRTASSTNWSADELRAAARSFSASSLLTVQLASGSGKIPLLETFDKLSENVQTNLAFRIYPNEFSAASFSLVDEVFSCVPGETRSSSYDLTVVQSASSVVTSPTRSSRIIDATSLNSAAVGAQRASSAAGAAAAGRPLATAGKLAPCSSDAIYELLRSLRWIPGDPQQPRQHGGIAGCTCSRRQCGRGECCPDATEGRPHFRDLVEQHSSLAARSPLYR